MPRGFPSSVRRAPPSRTERCARTCGARRRRSARGAPPSSRRLPTGRSFARRARRSASGRCFASTSCSLRLEDAVTARRGRGALGARRRRGERGRRRPRRAQRRARGREGEVPHDRRARAQRRARGRRDSRRSRRISPSGSSSWRASGRRTRSSRRSTAAVRRSPSCSARRSGSRGSPTTRSRCSRPRGSTSARRSSARASRSPARTSRSRRPARSRVVESEGNGRMCTTLPETLVTVMGVEKVVEEWRDLGVLMQLLPRSATGERMNPYTSLWTGVSPGDGPSSFHLVLVDAGRTRVLGDPDGQAGAPLHPLLRLRQRLPRLPADRRSRVRHRLPGADRRDPAAAALGRAGDLGVAALRLDALRRVRGRVPGRDRHPADPRARAGEGRASARARASTGGRFARSAARSRAPSATSAPSGRRVRSSGRSSAPGACGGSRGRSRAGGARGRCPASPRRRSASGGRNVNEAREAVLARIRTALSDGAAVPDVPRDYAERGAGAHDDVVARFVAQVEELGGAVVSAVDARSAIASTLAAHGASRVVVAPDLPPALRPDGVELVEDGGLTPWELDALDGALTTCAAACADTGTVALDGGPGTGTAGDHARARPPRVRRHARPGRRDRAGALRAPRARRRATGRPIVLVSGPSATSDLGFERVEGVHGPRRFVVVLAP